MGSVGSGGGSRSREAVAASTESVPFWAVVVSSEGEEFTMSVTGRMGPGCVSEGAEESVCSEGGGGGGEDLGGSLGEITSLMHGEAGSTSWGSSKGASPLGD